MLHRYVFYPCLKKLLTVIQITCFMVVWFDGEFLYQTNHLDVLLCLLCECRVQFPVVLSGYVLSFCMVHVLYHWITMEKTSCASRLSTSEIPWDLSHMTWVTWPDGSGPSGVSCDDDGGEWDGTTETPRCVAGTVGQICNTQDPASTKCVPCPKNYFMKTASKSSDMLQCSTMKKCSRNRGKIKHTLICSCV